METPTATAAGAVLALFGAALLLWCAAELRLRHRLRREGLPAAARVVADDVHSGLDSAPLLAFSALRAADGDSDGPFGRGEPVLARPRGHTPLRRPARLTPGAVVHVAYDPRRPTRVVLAASEPVPTMSSDLFWTAFGAGSLAAGLGLLTSVLAR